MLKKICPNCEKEYNSLDVVKCEDCDSEVYLYLTEDKGIAKLKSAFSSNKQEEKELVNQLESLFKWDLFFKAIDSPEKYDREFFSDVKDFKIAIGKYDFPEIIVIESDEYKFYLKGYYKALEFLSNLDQFLEKCNSYNLNKEAILGYLSDESIGSASKEDYVRKTLSRIDEIKDLDYFYLLDSYDDDFKDTIADFKDVSNLIDNINDEIILISNLSKDFSKFKRYFSGFSDIPENFDEFKERLFSIRHANAIPYFRNDLRYTIADLEDMNATFNAYDGEIAKVKRLNSQIPKFKTDFDNLIDDIIDDYTKHKFLDKYQDFKKDLFSFKYLKLLNDTDEIKGLQKFFNNFDDEWDILVAKKAQLDKKEAFKKDLQAFNSKWDSFDFDNPNKKELYKELAIFKSEIADLKENYSDFINENQFSSYSQFFDYISKLENQIDSLDFGNFKVSILLNYLKDSSVNDSSKTERLNSYKEMLNKLDSLDLEALHIFDSSFEAPYDDISDIRQLFADVENEMSKAKDSKAIPEDFNYLSILPYFDSSLKEYVETLSESKNLNKRLEIEKNKIGAIILDCSRCKIEFEMVNEGKMSWDDFLDKYSSLKEEVLSFEYLELLPSFDSSLKDFVEVVGEVRQIFTDN